MRILMDIIFAISMAVAFLSQTFMKNTGSDTVCFLVLMFWIMAAFFKFIISYFTRQTFKRNSRRRLLSELFALNNYVRIIIYIYTVFLVYSGLTEERFLSSNVQTFINGVSAIAMVYLFKERAFKNSVAALVLAYIYSIITGLINLRSFVLASFIHIFELHDIAFAVGLVVIYYMCIKEYWKVSNIKNEFISLFIFLLAYKRIGIMAVVVSLIFWKIAIKQTEVVQRSMMKTAGWTVLLVSFLYVGLILSGILFDILKNVDINMQGRNYYYSVFSGQYNIGIHFLGLGRNAVSVIMTEDYPWFNIGNVHSDILRMYLECGFVLFGIWLWNYLLLLPRKMEKLCGLRMSLFTFVCTLYMFIVYFTDNTELYLCTQYFYILMLIQYYYYLSHQSSISGQLEEPKLI